MSRTRWRLPAGLLAALAAHGAPADLVGRDAAERALLEANPVLERIARERPNMLDDILDRLRTPVPSPRRSSEEAEPAEPPNNAPMDELFGENPALFDYYRSSPEAALDLLQLIREAAKER